MADSRVRALGRGLVDGDIEAEARLATALERSMPIPLLISFAHQTRPRRQNWAKEWEGGEHVEMLRGYLGVQPKVVALTTDKGFGRRGRVMATIVVDVGQPLPIVYLFRDSFGDCTSCDELAGSFDADYLASVSDDPRKVRAFWGFEKARQFLATTEEGLWDAAASKLLRLLVKAGWEKCLRSR